MNERAGLLMNKEEETVFTENGRLSIENRQLKEKLKVAYQANDNLRKEIEELKELIAEFKNN